MTKSAAQLLYSRQSASTGLRAPGWLARWPLIGLGLFLLGMLIFSGMSLDYLDHGPFIQYDNALAAMLPAIAAHGPAFLRGVMDYGFYLGKDVITLVSIVLGIYFLYTRAWEDLALLAVGCGGAGLLFFTLTPLFHRMRPPTQLWIVVNLPGFPSGHAISSVVFYGLMAYLLSPRMPSTFWKVMVWVAAVFIVLFIGFTRVFTGGHYLTDILAGYAVGLAWCGAAFTLIELYFRRRKNRHAGEA